MYINIDIDMRIVRSRPGRPKQEALGELRKDPINKNNTETSCALELDCHETNGLDCQVTALEADSAQCSLEISLVAWQLDAPGMLEFHKHVWDTWWGNQ